MDKKRDSKKLTDTIKHHNDYREEERHPLDKFNDQKFADEIPLKDLKIEIEQEKNKHKTQDDSQSENKYKSDFDKN